METHLSDIYYYSSSWTFVLRDFLYLMKLPRKAMNAPKFDEPALTAWRSSWRTISMSSAISVPSRRMIRDISFMSLSMYMRKASAIAIKIPMTTNTIVVTKKNMSAWMRVFIFPV